MKKRIIACMLTGIMTMGMLAGCGGSSGNAAGSGEGAADAGKGGSAIAQRRADYRTPGGHPERAVCI